MSQVMDLAKFAYRHVGYGVQLSRDMSWHLRYKNSDMPPLQYRILEQAKLLFTSAINGEDYYNHGLFRSDMSFAEKARFLGYYKNFRYYDKINPTQFDALARDKVLFQILAQGLGLSVPELVAVTASSTGPACGRRLVDKYALESFLLENTSCDLFFKPAAGSFGSGALAIGGKASRADRWWRLPGDAKISLAEIIEHVHFRGKMSRFLIQRRLRPHAALNEIVADVCSTVRIMTYTTNETVAVLGAALRLGSGRDPTDNLSGGGVVVAVDLVTGVLGAVTNIDKGIPERMTAHPVSGVAITGKCVPDWPGLLSLVKDAALKLSFMPCIGWDIAVTDAGPVIVEINNTPRCRPVQVASDSGILVGSFREFLLSQDGVLRSGLHLRKC